MEYLFSKILLYSKYAFEKNEDDNTCLYIIYKNEFLNVIKTFPKNATTVTFLSSKIRIYASKIGCDQYSTKRDTELWNLLIKYLDNALKNVDDGKEEIFNSLFTQLKLCCQESTKRINMTAAVSILSYLIEGYLNRIIDTESKEKILLYLLRKKLDNKTSYHYYASEIDIMKYIDKYIEILSNKYKKK